MSTHPSTLAWRILPAEEPGGFWSMGSQTAGHNWGELAHTHEYNVNMKYLFSVPNIAKISPNYLTDMPSKTTEKKKSTINHCFPLRKDNLSSVLEE